MYWYATDKLEPKVSSSVHTLEVLKKTLSRPTKDTKIKLYVFT